MSVNSFAPEMIELFRRAATAEVTIQCSTHAKAVSFRHRLHSLRRAMRKENHYLASLAEQVVIRIAKRDDGKATMIAGPGDPELVAALRQAGVAPPDFDEAVQQQNEEDKKTGASSANALDEFLHRLK